MLGKGMIHIPIGTERDGATQNSMQFKNYKLFTSEIFHVALSDPS